MSESIIEKKTLVFSQRIIDLYKYLLKDKNEFVLSKQILRSGTSIGANVAEGLDGESRADFKHKLNIALKEASETIYWLKLIKYGGYINDDGYDSLYSDAKEIKAILVSIIKTINETG